MRFNVGEDVELVVFGLPVLGLTLVGGIFFFSVEDETRQKVGLEWNPGDQ